MSIVSRLLGTFQVALVLWVSVCWIMGTGIGAVLPLVQFQQLQMTLWWWVLSCLVLLWVIHLRALRWVLLSLMVVALGAWWYQNCSYRLSLDVAQIEGTTTTLSGVLWSGPVMRGNQATYALHASKVWRAGFPVNVNVIVLFKTDAYPRYQPGDVLQVLANWQLPSNSGAGFDYRAYLQHQNIYLMADAPKQVAKDGQVVWLLPWRWLDGLHQQIVGTVGRVFAEPEAGLLTGILLGDKQGVDPGLYDAMKRTGTTHLVGLSGYDVALVLVMAGWLLQKRVSRQAQFWTLVIVMVMFVLLAGLSPSLVRAALLIALTMIATQLGRLVRRGNCLLLATALVLGVDPVAIWDTGLQLSFLALAGIIWLYPLLLQLKAVKYCKRQCWIWSKSKKWWRYWSANIGRYALEILLLNLSAQLIVLPLQMMLFGQISIVSLVVNVLVMFVLPAIFVSGALAVVIGSIAMLVALPVAIVGTRLMQYVIGVIDGFSRLPQAVLAVGNVSWQFVLVWYGVVGVLFVVLSSRQRRELWRTKS